MLRELEAAAATPAAPTDLLEGWLAPELAEQLHRGGMLSWRTCERIRLGGRWWAGIRAYGPTKATRLAANLNYPSTLAERAVAMERAFGG